MEKIKLGIAAICKNEERFIHNFIEHHRKMGFNDFVIVDTGSTDATIRILKNLNIAITEKQFKQINFQDFRNVMWRKVMESGLDYVIVLDIDERLMDTSKDEIIEFLESNPENWAFEINRQDIAAGYDTKLKRILKVEFGFWTNCVHEHFSFYKTNELHGSPFNVLHLSTERIRSKSKCQLYNNLCEKELYAKGKIDYLYFALLETFHATDTKRILNMWEEFKSINHEHNFFLELIFSVFYRYSVILENTQFENDVLSFLKLFKLFDLEKRLKNFRNELAQCGIVEFKTDEFNFLGKPNKTFLIFARSEKDDQVIQIVQPLLDKLIRYGVNNSIDIGDKIVIKLDIINDIIFNKIFFSNLVKPEKVEIFKFCAKNNIIREMYYEQ